MKHSILVISVLLLITACTPSVPSEYIQPGDMEDILYDYHLAQALAKEDRVGNTGDFERSKYFYAVLKKHDVTKADFDSSLVYYYSHLDRLRNIYLEVNERLSDKAKALGASVGEIGRYSQYSTYGDTANIWPLASDVMLMPCPTMNRFDFSIKPDTSYHKGDSFMFQFTSDFLWQNSMKDGVVCIMTKYEGDSIIQTFNHFSVSGLTQLRIPAIREKRLKELEGFIYIRKGNDEDNDDNTRKILFVSQMQLIRFHHKEVTNETVQTDSLKAGSIQRGDIAGGPKPDSIRGGATERIRRNVLSSSAGNAQHRMATRPDITKKRN